MYPNVREAPSEYNLADTMVDQPSRNLKVRSWVRDVE